MPCAYSFLAGRNLTVRIEALKRQRNQLLAKSTRVISQDDMSDTAENDELPAAIAQMEEDIAALRAEREELLEEHRRLGAAEGLLTERRPPRNTRPQKVLTSKKVPRKHNKELSDRNATDSPLLNLPPEVRSRIWRAVLCPGTIHIRIIEEKIDAAVCKEPLGPAAQIALGRRTRMAMYAGHKGARGGVLHIQCGAYRQTVSDLPAPNRLDLNLLITCRQIHAEACLLPFSDNAFAIHEGTVRNAFGPLQGFLKLLVREQAEAIKSLYLYLFDPMAEVEKGRRTFIRERLAGLERLWCQVVCDHLHDGPALLSRGYKREREKFALFVLRGMAEQVDVFWSSLGGIEDSFEHVVDAEFEALDHEGKCKECETRATAILLESDRA